MLFRSSFIVKNRKNKKPTASPVVTTTVTTAITSTTEVTTSVTEVIRSDERDSVIGDIDLSDRVELISSFDNSTVIDSDDTVVSVAVTGEEDYPITVVINDEVIANDTVSGVTSGDLLTVSSTAGSVTENVTVYDLLVNIDNVTGVMTPTRLTLVTDVPVVGDTASSVSDRVEVIESDFDPIDYVGEFLDVVTDKVTTVVSEISDVPTPPPMDNITVTEVTESAGNVTSAKIGRAHV